MRYLFKHILMRDTVYDMQLRAQLRHLHRQAAEAIEDLHANDLLPFYADLAYHYGRAEEVERAVHYTRLAGEHALTTSAYQEARAILERGLQLLDDLELPARDTDRHRMMLLRLLGSALYRLGEFPQAQACTEESLSLARRLEDLLAEATALSGMGNVHRRRGEYETARTVYRQSLEIARETGDPGQIASALNALGSMDYSQGDYDSAGDRYQRSLALYREVEDSRGIERCLNNLGAIAHVQGKYDEAQGYYQQSLAISCELEARQSMGIALLNIGLVAREQGDDLTAHGCFQEALFLFRLTGDRWGIATALADLVPIQVRLQQPENARRSLREGLLTAHEIAATPCVLNLLVGAAELALYRGRPERAAEWAGLVVHHPATEQDYRDEARKLYTTLEAAIEPQELAAAWAQGQSLELDEAFRQVMQEMEGRV